MYLGSEEKPGPASGFASPCPDAEWGAAVVGRMEERGALAGRGREGVK